jgi:MoCo/4Fe-4S cofactor protein with predicted Tat translocation signal
MTKPINATDAANLAAIRARLGQAGGKQFWQSLEELAGTDEYREFLHHEFPRDPEKEPVDGTSRRDVLKLMAASAALAGLSACTKLPDQKIVPYVRSPEEIIPGKPLFYATSMPQGGVATGILVESHMGRPTKVEGNKEHPGSLGATDSFAQASVLTLYDPDRSQVLVHEGRISSWAAFLTAIGTARDAHRTTKGAGMRLLTETVTSPTLKAQLDALRAAFPAMKWHQYEPCARNVVHEGARLAFGKPVNTVYRFDQADVIISLDADFLCSGPGSVRYAREFSARRRVDGPESKMNRLYVVECTPSNTGAMADHRLPMRAQEIEDFARALAAGIGVHQAGPKGAVGKHERWLGALVRDLDKHRGACLIVAGEQQPAMVHALAHAMNAALGNVGKTVVYTDPIEAEPVDQMQSLRELVADIKAGQVDFLLIHGSNPVFNAPAELDFAHNLLRVKLRIHLGLYNDETAELCHWHVPEAHFLESWSDARAYDGTVGILQPLISPLYDGKSAHELLAALLGKTGISGHDIVREHWKSQRPAKEKNKDFETFWQTTLHDGVMTGSALPPRAVTLNAAFPSTSKQDIAPGLEIVFRPDPTIGDGRYANNGWLQEIPKPLTKLTWDNAAMLSPTTAERLRVSNGDVVKLSLNGREVRAPIWIQFGHAAESVTVHFGYGRRRAGRIGNGVGFNAYTLRTSGSPWFAGGLQLERTGEKYALATTQHHHMVDREGKKVEEESVNADQRDLIRVATLAVFRKDPKFAQDHEEESSKALKLYPGFQSPGYAWGMAIDLNSCIGCGACVTACQAENNLPIVGKAEVIAGREMHWIRVDTYFRGGLDSPETYYEPVLCMHCENAPCELVCPVGATVHSPEGLNEMVYNRCVGTRYCSNNCPYKVRRFNFKLYSDWTTPSLYPLRNPNVTVRSRGVMEKCTYCVQRINAVKIEAEKQDRDVNDGEIVTACQAVCPAEAIVFGDINDANNRVSKLKAQTRNYSLLAELNTRPRTTYLARLRNPNPEIEV